jgi:hypothetical protein
VLRSDFPLRGADIGHGDYLLTLGSAQSLLCRARTFPRRSEHLLVALPSETHAHHARSSRNEDGPNQPAPSLLHLDGGTAGQSIEHSLLERSDLLELSRSAAFSVLNRSFSCSSRVIRLAMRPSPPLAIASRSVSGSHVPPPLPSPCWRSYGPRPR